MLNFMFCFIDEITWQVVMLQWWCRDTALKNKATLECRSLYLVFLSDWHTLVSLALRLFSLATEHAMCTPVGWV